MKPRRTKKKPLTSPTVEASVSRRVTQAEITSFHTNLKRQARLRSLLVARESDSAAFKQTNLLLAQVDSDIVALGGLEAYQRASKLGQSTERGGDSSRVLIKWLRDVKSKRFNHGDGGQRSTGQMLRHVKTANLIRNKH